LAVEPVPTPTMPPPNQVYGRLCDARLSSS